MTKKLDYKARLVVQKVIEANGSLDEDGVFWKYNEGWDDARVARDTGSTREAVAHTRSQTYGRIKKGPGSGGSRAKPEGSRVEHLEREVANLKHRMRHLEEVYLPGQAGKVPSNSGKLPDPERL